MAWLGDWHKRREISIPTTYIDAALSNFPVTLRISASAGTGAADLTDIFDVLGSNSLRLAVTTSDGQTQCYVEIALWDTTNEIGVLYVKVPSVSNSATTKLYIYYDNNQPNNSTYVGVVGSTPGQNVWDNDFLGVYHLAETPSGSNSIKDSTWRGCHASPQSTPDLSTIAQVDKSLDFERDDSEYLILPGKTEKVIDYSSSARTITCGSRFWVHPTIYKNGDAGGYFNAADANSQITVPDSDDWTWPTQFTFEVWIYFVAVPSTSGTIVTILKHKESSTKSWEFSIRNVSGTMNLRLYEYDGAQQFFMERSPASNFVTGQWYHLAVSRDSSSDVRMFVDGTQCGTTHNSSRTPTNYAGTLRIGGDDGSRMINGVLDDLRISDTARYTANFTPPSAAFSNDLNTKLLLNFDQVTVSNKGHKAFTYEAVFRYESYNPTSQNHSIVYESTSTSGYTRFGLNNNYVGASDMRLSGVMRDTATGTSFSVTDDVSLSLDTWYHGALAVNTDTESLRLVKNGSERGENTTAKAAFPLTHSATELAIAAFTAATNYYFDGLIDEVRISKTARSTAWLKATYYTLFDLLVSYAATEENAILVSLGVATLEIETPGFVADIAAVIALGTASLQAQGHNLSMSTVAIVNIGAQAQLAVLSNDIGMGFVAIYPIGDPGEIIVSANFIKMFSIPISLSSFLVSGSKPKTALEVSFPAAVIGAVSKPKSDASSSQPAYSASWFKPKTSV